MRRYGVRLSYPSMSESWNCHGLTDVQGRDCADAPAAGVVYACFGATSEVDLLSKIEFRSRSVNRKYDPPTQWELGKLVSLMTVKISSSICSSSEVTRSVYLVHYCSHWHSFCSD
jgi:hypothetical protein